MKCVVSVHEALITLIYYTVTQCGTVREGLYRSQVQNAARVAALCRLWCVVVSCCSGSMVGQLLYWLA